MKLNDYKGMVQQVGITEWKQIGFTRLRGGSLGDISGVGHAVQMEVLNLLYSSLGRALLGAGIAMRVHGETPSLITKILPLIQEICEQIMFWQRRYEIAYGSNFYIGVYAEQISELQHEILELRRTDSEYIDSLSTSLNRVEQSWLQEQRSVAPVTLGHLGEMPQEDLVTLVARYGRGLLVGVKDWINIMDKQRAISVYTARFLATRGQLAALLEARLPTYTEMIRYTSYLLADIQTVVLSGTEVAATGEHMLQWCINERSMLQNISDELKENRYDVPEQCDMSQMSELKKCYNNVITATEKLARHLGVADTEHLSLKWQ